MLSLNFSKSLPESIHILLVQVLSDGKTTALAPKEISDRLSLRLKQDDFSAQAEEIITEFISVNDRIIQTVFLGLGEKSQLTPDKLRAIGAKAYLSLGPVVQKTVGYIYDERILGPNAHINLLEGLFLRNYLDAPYKTGEEAKKLQAKLLTSFTLIGNVLSDVKKELHRILTVTDGVHFARTLVSTPAAELTPDALAQTARNLAKDYDTLEVKVLHKADLEREDMRLLLAVNQGSLHEPRLIILTLNPNKKEAPVVLVGKGITFDSGGYNLKSSGGMENMHTDMAGAAAVIGAMKVLAEIGYKHRVIGIVPATENLISGSAFKPADVIRSHSGLTVEIGNTDAEGRLILADALSYANRFHPSVMLDLATLTGASVVALGERYAGLFSDSNDLAKQIQKAADISGDKVWRMPLDDFFKEKMKGKIGDLNNIGPLDRIAGASTGAAFLSYFVGNTKWAHLDIAGPNHQSKELEPWNPPSGSTGYGVRLLVELISEQL